MRLQSETGRKHAVKVTYAAGHVIHTQTFATLKVMVVPVTRRLITHRFTGYRDRRDDDAAN